MSGELSTILFLLPLPRGWGLRYTPGYIIYIREFFALLVNVYSPFYFLVVLLLLTAVQEAGK